MVRDICRGGDTAEKDVQKAARRVMSMATTRETLRPKGEWPEHWKDEMHEPDGGSDSRGIRPQVGCDLLKKEMHMLNCRNGVEYAEDDVSNQVLDPTLLKEARREEMKYFEKLGVYERVARSEQQRTGGKVIGTRWVDVNKGDSESPNYRSRLVGR